MYEPESRSQKDQSSAPLSSERVLLVEDDDGLRNLLAEELQDAGLQVEAVPSAERAVEALRKKLPAVVVSDLRLPGAGGMDLLRRVQELPIPPSFIVITAFGSIPQAVDALKAGADDFLTKPLNLEHLVLAVKRSLETQRLREKVQRFEELLGEDHFHGILGRCQTMRSLFGQIRQVARASGPVLIEGESGAGKELVARAVHAESPRADGPFLAVNVAGVPGELLESEFFGHAKGAFTGAQEKRAGLFVEASGGTLLLDEIAEMPVALQAKLLRVLQEGAVRPVGSNHPTDVDVRILASTNRNLEKEVEKENFREDLFFRLETFRLKVPPLREREDDLDVLAAHFIRHYSRELGKEVEGLSSEALQLLKRYDFPGNVRELKNAMERAVAFCDEARIEPRHLPERIQGADGGDARWGKVQARADASASLLHVDEEELPPLAEIERRYIRHVLERVAGNKSKAAEVLGIGRRTLYRRLEEARASDAE